MLDRILAALLISVLGLPAQAAATITRQDTVTGAGWRPAALSGVTLGRCGTGGVVAGDGCAPVTAAGLTFGQGLSDALNSQDTDLVEWTISSTIPFTSIWIEAQDARDQARSRWALELEGATAQLLERQIDGTRSGWLVMLDRIVNSVTARVSTRHNDGYSIRASVCR